MKKSMIISLVVAPILTATSLAGVTPAAAQIAAAAPSQKSTESGLVFGEGYVIVDPNSAVQFDGATFYPTGPISDDTLVVIPGAAGSLPGGLTVAPIPALGRAST